MAAPLEIDLTPPPYLRSEPSRREMRIRFESRDALIEGLARARREAWIEEVRVDGERRELVLRLAGGFHHAPPRRLH
jgi:hypothetical protein